MLIVNVHEKTSNFIWKLKNSNKKIRVALAGATGYSGRELIKFLVRHSGIEIIALAHSPGKPDKFISETFPELKGICDLNVTDISRIIELDNLDVVFLALPHCAAMTATKPLLKKGIKVIDFSADYRLKNVETYEKWYNVQHTDTTNLTNAVYGLCEHNRKKIKSAKLIANPGCYPTGALLPLIPLLKENIIEPNGIIIDAKSGVSGAGKKVSEALQFAEINESFKAYGIFSHRHTPEINQELSVAADKKIEVVFTPHLLPVQRGIQSTIYVDCKRQIGTSGAKLSNEISSALKNYYKNEFFIRIKPEGSSVELKHVTNTNFCDISFHLSKNKLILVSAIDNLIKGAAGQALQNFNIMFGFDEKEGLI